MANKRSQHPRAADYAKEFSKDWERLNRSGRFDMPRLKNVMLKLVGYDAPLGPEWRDHPLKGEWHGYRECHIGGDFLLVYRVDESAGKAGKIYFARLGTHTELFRE